MRFRPCIDIHNGKVKQIVGSSLRDEGATAKENFISGQDASWYARMFRERSLAGGHMIILNKKGTPEYDESLKQCMGALKEYLFSVNNSLFKTEINFVINYRDDMKLDADMFDSVQDYLDA